MDTSEVPSTMSEPEDTGHEQQLLDEETQYQKVTDETMAKMALMAERAKSVAPELVLHTQAERVAEKKSTAEFALVTLNRMFDRAKSSSAANGIADYSEWNTTHGKWNVSHRQTEPDMK